MGYFAFATQLKPEHRYPIKVKLPRHEDQTGKRDPRKVWLYETGLQKWSVEHEYKFGDIAEGNRVYRFANESDATVFVLRWGGEIVDDRCSH